MIQTFKMAFRDLGRNRRRSFFSSLALGIGLALLLLMAGFFQGEMRGAMNDSIRLQSGHLQVRAKSYDETKTSLAWTDLIADPNQVAAQVAAIPQVLLATPRLFATGIIGTSDQSIGVRIIGIDPASAANAPYRDGMVAGTFLTADDRNGVLMGKALADKLGLKSGDTIDLLANTSNGDVDEQVFTIRGVYDTHTPGFDQTALFLPLAKAQALTRTENHASTIFVLVKNIDQTQAVANALQGSQYTISTYLQLNQIISDTEQLANSYIYMLYLIVLAITATVIVNTLIMAVFERTREIGILSAIGMRSRQIMSMFLAESFILAVGGVAMGLLLGGALVAYLSIYGFYIGNFGLTGILVGERIYAYFNPSDAVNLTIIAFIITLLAALYPALLAARMEPVQALHSGD